MVVKSKKYIFKHVALTFDCLAIVGLVLYIASSSEIVDSICICVLIAALLIELSYRLYTYKKCK